jgi:transcription initiation factor IIE alpha subunit
LQKLEFCSQIGKRMREGFESKLQMLFECSSCGRLACSQQQVS